MLATNNLSQTASTRLLKTLFLLSLLTLFPYFVSAQKNVTLSGYVKDAASGETLTGAAIFVAEKNTGVFSNNYGFYSLTLSPGTYQLKIGYSGYITQEVSVSLTENTTQNFELELRHQAIGEVTISSDAPDKNVKSTDMGVVSLDVAKIKKLPVLMGEIDVMKTLQLLPGVQSAGEGNSGFYIRGGGPDQNLVMLDNATVYNTGHLLGFFSVFNGDAIKNVKLIKGIAPASYGGRLSSVVDVEMRDGNKKSYHTEGGIGLIASRLTVEGPIVKDKSSFMVSGRRTYIDVLTKPFIKGKMKGTGYYFYDLNLKADYILSDKDHLFLSGYFGKDVFVLNSSSGTFHVNTPWGNSTASLRWNHQFNSKLFMNTTAVYNSYDFAFKASFDDFGVGMKSAIRDWNGKIDFDYFPSINHQVKFGTIFTNHKFTPNQISGNSKDMEFSPNGALIKYGNEMGFYALDEFNLGQRIKINAGLRYLLFAQIGPYTDFQLNKIGNKIDSTYYPSGKLVESYSGLEPRLSMRFLINDNNSIKAGLGKTMQYLSLVTNNGSTMPTDIWVPSTARVKPQISYQYSIGYFGNFLDNTLETSVELYYKDLKNQIEYRSSYIPSTNRDSELDFVFGKGWAYGAEFFVNKTLGKFTGWIGYTLAWTWRQFDDLNQGKPFPAKYDRRHDLSVVASYELNKQLSFSGVFVFGTGNAITLPTSYYFLDSRLMEDFSELNAYRLFNYHRLDLSVVYTPKHKRNLKWEDSWALSVYNVYNRHNPYFLFIDKEGAINTGTKISVKQVSIFPIIPSITYNFKF